MHAKAFFDMNPEKLIRTTLQAYSLGGLKSFEVIKQGFANENYRVVAEKGTFLFRIHRQQTPENIKKEHRMLGVLKEMHFPTSFPVPDKTGKALHIVDSLPISIYDFIKGKTPELTVETVAEVASAMALLHSVDTSTLPEKQNIIRPAKVNSLVKRFSTAKNPLPDIFEQFTMLWWQVEPYLHEKLPTGLIHSDVFPDNTLFEGNKLKAIIDFEEFCIDTLLFDIAMCINGFCFIDNRLNKRLLEVFLYAYNQKRPMENTEEEMLPYYIRWTSLSMASWHLRYHLMYRPDARQEKRVRELLERVEHLLSV